MAAARILVVDDEPKIASILLLYLKHEGFQADAAATGREALRLLDENRYRLVILDLMLPDVPGEEICRRIREESDLPVLMLTAKTAESDQLKGFRTGTDDYVTKPFSPRAVMARVKALLRRSRGEAPGNGRTYEFNGADLVIDTARVGGEADRFRIPDPDRPGGGPGAGLFPVRPHRLLLGRRLPGRGTHGRRPHQKPAAQTGGRERGGRVHRNATRPGILFHGGAACASVLKRG